MENAHVTPGIVKKSYFLITIKGESAFGNLTVVANCWSVTPLVCTARILHRSHFDFVGSMLAHGNHPMTENINIPTASAGLRGGMGSSHTVKLACIHT